MSIDIVNTSFFVFARLGGLLSSLAAITILLESYGDTSIVPSTLFAYQTPILMHSLAQTVGFGPFRFGAFGNFTTCSIQGIFVVGGSVSGAV